MKIGTSKTLKNVQALNITQKSILALFCFMILTNCKGVKNESDNRQLPDWFNSTTPPQGQIIISEDFKSRGGMNPSGQN